MQRSYATYLEAKEQTSTRDGFRPTFMPDSLFDFQQYVTADTIEIGRAQIQAGCGLGKTPMGLVFAENVRRHTGGNVLIVAPLSVAAQWVREGEKFGIEVRHSRDGKVHRGITVTNYERLHYFDPADFAGVVYDEFSIIKHFGGKTQRSVTNFNRKIRYRLGLSATQAPNDPIEFGTASEALGYLGQKDILSRYFKITEDSNPSDFKQKYVFRAHGQIPFYRYLASWMRAGRRPSDFGPYSDHRYELPPLNIAEHTVASDEALPGCLFPFEAASMQDKRAENRLTIEGRCQKAADLLNHNRPAVAWVQLNDEADLIERMIPGAVQIKGEGQSDEEREEIYAAFESGQISKLVTKPGINAFGMNWQHCRDFTCFPNDSFERWYQLVRRFWRFGQKGAVNGHLIVSEGSRDVVANLQRKEAQADAQFDFLISCMNEAVQAERETLPAAQLEVPAWLF